MEDTKIIIRKLGQKKLQQADYALLSKELGAQNICRISVDEVPGQFGEPITLTVILAIGAATSITALAVGLAGWLMKSSEEEVIVVEFDVQHPDGRIEHRVVRYKKSSQGATDPELLKALKEALPNFSPSA